MKKVFAVTAALALLGLSIAAQADVFDLGPGYTNLETVVVGDAGNAKDTLYETPGYGAVGYAYSIGKYEVTAGQYSDFLNNKAKCDSDPYGLYNTAMDTSSGCGIKRTGTGGNYSYSVAPDWANRPVNYVSFWSACRFANWLGNGQGDGDTETGAYTLNGYNGIDGRNIQRNTGATWAVTSDDEWYKAAYYKGGSTDAGYWLYPTSSDTAPGQDMADASGNNANYFTAPYAYPIDSGKFTTVAGEFQNSDSPYGTFDQGGNVWEMNEAIFSIDEISGAGRAYRVRRGGAARDNGFYLKALNRDGCFPMGFDSDVGFRVVSLASVPEPSSIMVLAGCLGTLLGLRRRRV